MRKEVELDPSDYRREFRCPGCKIPRRICMCSEIPKVELPYRFFVIRHVRECDKQSNTGSLVPEMLPGSRLLDWGRPDQRLDRSQLEAEDAQFLNLFPLATAEPLTPRALDVPAGKTPTFIVLDATWSKARRMLHRVHEIQKYPFYHLPLGAQPERVLRRAPSDDQYSTLDSVVRAVEALGNVEEAARMRPFMEKLYSHILNARGRRFDPSLRRRGGH